MNKREFYPWRTIASFMLVLFAMPLGHALMILMEKFMEEGAMHLAGFLMGLVGLIMVIVGVMVKGEILVKRFGDYLAGCSSGQDGSNSCLCTMLVAMA